MDTAIEKFINEKYELYGRKIDIKLVQGTPLLMQLFIAFFGLGLFGIDVPAWLAAGLALILWSAAFLTEIWRGCVDAIPRGQWEAAKACNLSARQTWTHIVIPQAIPPMIALETMKKPRFSIGQIPPTPCDHPARSCTLHEGIDSTAKISQQHDLGKRRCRVDDLAY